MALQPGVRAGAVHVAQTDASDTYRNPDGSFTAVIHAAPLRRHTAAGWAPLAGKLQRSDSPAYAFTVQDRLTTHLPAQSAGGWTTVTATDGRSVSFALANAVASPGVVQADGQTLKYAGALPGVDLYLSGRPDGGVKERLAIASLGAVPPGGTFTYYLKLDGLKAQVEGNGRGMALCEAGTGIASPVLHVAPAFAVDSAGRRTDACIYGVSSDQKSLTLTVDPAWLAQASYPVTVDPTVTDQPVGGTGLNTFVDFSSGGVNSYFGTGSFPLVVGDMSSMFVVGGVSFVRFNVNDIPKSLFYDATVTSASLTLTPIGGSALSVTASQAVQGWDPVYLTAATIGQNASPTPITTQTIDPNNSATWSIPVTAAVQSWASGISPNCGFVLTRNGTSGGIELAASDAAALGYPAQDCPALTITYTTGTSPNMRTYCGAPRSWQAGESLNPYQTLNLSNGNVLTTLPITGWSGFGPSVSLALVHNSLNTVSSPSIATNWQWNYSTRLFPVDGTSSDPMSSPTLIRPDGGWDRYANPTTINGVTTYASPPGVYDVLTWNGSQYVLTHPNQVQDRYYAFSGGSGVTPGLLASIVDPSLSAGNEVDLSYDAGGRLIQIQDANPVAGNRRSLAIGYNGNGQAATVTDPLGRVWTLTYDGSGNLVGVTLPDRIDWWSIPAGGHDSLTDCYVFAYDGDSNITSIGDPDHNAASVLTSGGQVYLYNTEYDEYGRGMACLGRQYVSTRHMKGLYVAYEYNSSTPFQPTAAVVSDQDFVHGKYVFDSSGRLSSQMLVSDPTDPEANWSGPTTTYNLDGDNNLVDVRLPGSPATIGGNAWWDEVIAYNTGNAQPGSPGNVLTETTHVLDTDSATSEDLSLEHKTAYTYDSGGHNRVTQVTSTATRDANGNATDRHVTLLTFDNNPTGGWKKPTSAEQYDDDAPGTTWSTSYVYYDDYYHDTAEPGKVITRTDAGGNQWGYTYDAWGNVTGTSAPVAGRATSASYDATAHLLPISSTDAAHQTFDDTYHVTGTNPDWRLETLGPPGAYFSQEDAFAWEPNGELLEDWNGISSSSSVECVPAYTDGGLVLQDGRASYNDNLQPVRSYDAMGRTTGVVYGVDYDSSTNTMFDHNVTYNWSDMGQLTSKVLTPDQNCVNLLYDDIPTLTTALTYDAGGRVTQQRNQVQRLATNINFTLTSQGAETQRQVVTAGGTVQGTFTVTRRADGLVTQLTSTVGSGITKNLSYDALGRMTEEDDYTGVGSGAKLAKRQVFGFDATGNRYFRAQYDGTGAYQQGEYSTYDAANQLTQILHYGAGQVLSSTENFVAGTDFDGNGNQLVSTGGKVYHFSYYPDNRLGSTSSSSYNDGGDDYFVDGRSNYGAGVVSEYDASDLVEELYPFPNTGTQALMEMFGPDAMIQYDGCGNVVSVGIAYSDPLGNVAFMTDPVQNLVQTCDQDLCGGSPTANGSASTNELQWECASGYRYRSTPNVYQLGVRVYDPTQGRFLQQDPLSFGSGDWTYAGNSPANAVDPTGLALKRFPGGKVWDDRGGPQIQPGDPCSESDDLDTVNKKIEQLKSALKSHLDWDRNHGTRQHARSGDIKRIKNMILKCEGARVVLLFKQILQSVDWSKVLVVGSIVIVGGAVIILTGGAAAGAVVAF